MLKRLAVLSVFAAFALIATSCGNQPPTDESSESNLEDQATRVTDARPRLAKPGDQVVQVPLPVAGFGVSVAVDCDGNVYYTNNGQFNLYVMDKTGALLNTLPTVDSATGAPLDFDEMAYDVTRNVLWAQLHGSNPVDVYHIDPATGVATFQWTSATISVGSFRDGIAYDGTDDTVWLSGDVSTTIEHYTSAGVPLPSITPKNAAGSNLGLISGITVGVGDLMYVGRNGAVEIVQVKKSNGDFISSFASPGGTRDEGLECDPVNFPTLVLWSRDVAGFLSVIEIEDGTCGCGGGEIEIGIDIKPGSCPNPINRKKGGVIPVGIIGTPSFDPTTAIDSISIFMAGVPALRTEVLDTTQPNDNPVGSADDCLDCFDAGGALNCDLDGDGINDAYCGDGIPDLIVYFDAQAVADALSDAVVGDCVEVELTATLTNGSVVVGHDQVIIRH